MMCNQGNVEVSQQQLAWLQQLELRRTTSGSSTASKETKDTPLASLYLIRIEYKPVKLFCGPRKRKTCQHSLVHWNWTIFYNFFCSKMSLHRNIFFLIYIYLICVFDLFSGDNHDNVRSSTHVSCFLSWQRRKREVTWSHRQKGDQRQVTQITNRTMKKFRTVVN